MIRLDGKQTSQQIKEEIKEKVAQRVAQNLKKPHLAAVLVGDDGASQTYVNAKVKACAYVGFDSTLVRMSAETSEAELLAKVDELNTNSEIDGFIVQLPLPKHIDEQKIIQAIDPNKDVDGFHPVSTGRMALGLETFLPATPMGIMELLKRYKVPTEGKNCVVVGRSHIVGLPMTILLGQNNYPGNCTVTMVHSRTQNLTEILQKADIIVAALGKPLFIKEEMVKEGAVIIDVGITRIDDPSKKSGYHLAGDVDYDAVAEKCSFITPVPGGVGPMTIASLLLNTLKSMSMK